VRSLASPQDAIDEVGLCPNCVPIEGIQEHLGALRRREPEANIARDACTSALLAKTRARSENPGVGGSIPSLPTSFSAT